MTDLNRLSEDYLTKLVRIWHEKIKAGRDQGKSAFNAIRKQCMAFYSGTAADVWAEKFQNQFFGTTIPTSVKISINKAFELVALFGPVLFSRYPERSVKPYDPIRLDPEAFNDPMQFQMLMAQQQREAAVNRIRCQILQQYLNYTPKEQPEGGLAQAAEDGITEGLITGMGLLWPEPYRMPGSDRTLTGCFYDSNANLVTDPNATRMDFGHTKWVARKHLDPYWEVERRFKLPTGTLKAKAQFESADAKADRQTRELPNTDGQRRETHDLLEWWEVWSIIGAGGRLSGMDQSHRQAFDETVGDYAYLAISANVPWPLNCPEEVFRTAMPEEIRQRFQWPVPYWLDRRWPFAPLTFYRDPNHPWPIAPLAPGLGELSLLNLLFSRMANQVVEGTKMIAALPASMSKDLQTAMKSGQDVIYLTLKDSHLKQMGGGKIGFLEFPKLHVNLWDLAAALMELFDKRVGLTELWYSLSPTQSRTATDVQAKQEKAAIRPDHMAQKVEMWLTEVSAMEKLCAYWAGVSGRDVQPLLGTVGAQMWDGLFANSDPEVIAREMQCEIAAGSVKKRNRQLELANLGQLYTPLVQQLSAYATVSTDTRPLNSLNVRVFDAMQFDGHGMEMGPWAPPPPPQQEMSPEETERIAAEAEEARKEESHDAELERKEETHDQTVEHADEKMDLERIKVMTQLRLARIKQKAA